MLCALAARPSVITRGCSSSKSVSGTSPCARASTSAFCMARPSWYSTRPSRRTCSVRLTAGVYSVRAAGARSGGRSEELVALLPQRPGRPGVDVVEERFPRRIGLLFRLGDGAVHVLEHLGPQLVLLAGAPQSPALQARAHQVQRVALLPLLDLALVAIAGGVVRRAVRADAVGLALDQRGSAAVARAIDRLLDGEIDGDGVVAVDLHAGKAVGGGFHG